MSNINLEFLSKHSNKFEIRLDKYQCEPLQDKEKYAPSNQIKCDEVGKYQQAEECFPAIQKLPKFFEPKICTWSFMTEEEVINLINCKSIRSQRHCIGNKIIGMYPKETPRTVVLDLLYSAFKFSRTSDFNPKQTAALLAIFYTTHIYFTSSYRANAEDVFYYFRDILTHHSLEYVPEYTKIFDPDTAHKIFLFFCKIYLRHLPIIKMLCLPNFNFEVNLTIQQPPVIKKVAKKAKK